MFRSLKDKHSEFADKDAPSGGGMLGLLSGLVGGLPPELAQNLGRAVQAATELFNRVIINLDTAAECQQRTVDALESIDRALESIDRALRALACEPKKTPAKKKTPATKGKR